MAANLSLPLLPFSPSKTGHRRSYLIGTNLKRGSRAPVVSMALSPLQKDKLLSFYFFPADVLVKTKPPQTTPTPSISPPPPPSDDEKSSDLEITEPAAAAAASSDIPPSKSDVSDNSPTPCPT
ncbi:hypothetical protein ACLOJK_002141 [Asimina triloba]